MSARSKEDQGLPVLQSLRTDAPSIPNPSLAPTQCARPAVWIDPASLPDYGDISFIKGNVSDDVKRLMNNTFFAYGVGDPDCFGFTTGKQVNFVEIRVDRSIGQQGPLQATTVAEVVVNKSASLINVVLTLNR